MPILALLPPLCIKETRLSQVNFEDDRLSRHCNKLLVLLSYNHTERQASDWILCIRSIVYRVSLALPLGNGSGTDFQAARQVANVFQ